MKRTWIVVADASRGRIFLRGGRDEQWEFIQEHLNPEARARSRDMQEDDARFQQAEGFHEINAMEPLSVKEVESRRFAEHLMDTLSRSEQQFDEIVLVAAPKFLGMLRQHLSPPLKKKLVGTLSKDFTHYDAREVASRLEDATLAT